MRNNSSNRNRNNVGMVADMVTSSKDGRRALVEKKSFDTPVSMQAERDLRVEDSERFFFMEQVMM